MRSAELLPLVYDELRRLARRKMQREPSGHTLQATALVHEAYLRLIHPGDASAKWDGRGHFFAAAAEAMRRILIDQARQHGQLKRGGGARPVHLDEVEATSDLPDDELLALDEALRQLALEEPAKAELVKLRFFAGLTVDEAAQVVGISSSTAERHWRYARAWLYRRMSTS